VAGLIAKKPLVGFAASILFGALGMLLVRMDISPAGLSRWLFKVVGYFVIFVAVNSLAAAVYAVVKGDRKRDE
jgi:hypothetical protein